MPSSTSIFSLSRKPDFLAVGLVSTCLVLSAAYASAQQSFTLQEAMDYAALNTPSVRTAQADLADAEGQIKETLALGLPKVNGSVGYQYNVEIAQQLFPDFITGSVYNVLVDEGVNNGSGQPVVAPQGALNFIPVEFGLRNQLQAGVNMNTLIFDATYFIALRGSRLYRNLAKRTVEQTAYQSRIQVAKAYLATLIAERNLQILERNVDNLNQTLSETRGLFEAGFAEKLSVDRLQLSADNLAAQRQSLEQVILISRNLLKFQMGFPVNTEVVLTTGFEEALGQARVTQLLDDGDFNVALRPEYATLQVADSLNELDLKRIRAGYYPNLVGFGNFSRTLNRNDLFDENEPAWLPQSAVGISLNVPIFDGFDKRAKRQRALARGEKTRIQLRQFEESARLSLVNAKAAVRNARLAVNLRENSIELAEEIYRVSQIKFREGVGSSLEVNQAQSELFAAQDALTQALYDLAVAFTDYQDALGQL